MMIEIADLSYTYPQRTRPALDRVSLRVGAGEFILLAGASGSGKSTLLRCFNGLVPHLTGGMIEGRVRVGELDPIAAGPQKMSRHVGYVFQNPEGQAVLDEVEAEIAFGLESSLEFQERGRRLDRAGRAELRREMAGRVGDVLALLGLEPLRARPLRTLSGGERQKVALASALALRPSLLVLDEPTSQLDPQAAADLLAALVRLNKEEGYTIILAEHRLERVLPYVDRVVYLEEGEIVLDAPPRAAAAALPHVPPVSELGRRLGWSPLPLTAAEARPFLNGLGGEAAGGIGRQQPSVNGHHLPEAADAPLLAVERLTAGYGGEPVLRDVSLAVGPGELVAVLGHNGAGKSTLLRCLVGLLRAERGEVVVGGRPARGRTTAEICREVGYLPQNPDDLLFADSVAEELAITLRNHGLPPDEGAAAGLLEQLGLAALGEAYPRDLSVGQRQRVALGAVTVTGPGLVLLDEPTRGLDFGAKEGLIAIWERWLAEGKGILLVTHDVELVARVAGRVVILEGGRVVEAGKPEVVLRRRASFTPQIGRLFPGRGYLTAADVLRAAGEHGLVPAALPGVGG